MMYNFPDIFHILLNFESVAVLMLLVVVELVIYGLNGVKKYEGELGGMIRAIVPTSSDTKLLVVLEDSIQLIKLR